MSVADALTVYVGGMVIGFLACLFLVWHWVDINTVRFVWDEDDTPSVGHQDQ